VPLSRFQALDLREADDCRQLVRRLAKICEINAPEFDADDTVRQLSPRVQERTSRIGVSIGASTRSYATALGSRVTTEAPTSRIGAAGTAVGSRPMPRMKRVPAEPCAAVEAVGSCPQAAAGGFGRVDKDRSDASANDPVRRYFEGFYRSYQQRQLSTNLTSSIGCLSM
jgi:hypothetical protein